MKYSFNIKKNKLLIFFALGVIAAFGLGLLVGESISSKTASGTSGVKVSLSSGKEPLDLDAFWRANEVLSQKFVPTTASSSVPSDADKVWGAIEGLAASYADPYTVFFPPKESKDFNDEVRGDFSGVGMEIAIKDKVLTVVAPLKNTPAEQAGIKAGDLILKIDKKFTAGMAVEDAVSLIRGPKGSTVVLTIKKPDINEPKEISVVRNTITIPTIDTKLRPDGVFVISLYNFSANSPTLFRGALREFIASGTDKLVLDLRNNPGGYLEAAADMASFFLPVGKTIVREEFGDKNEQVVRSFGYNIFTENLKMVILINEGSASASEILAGALREHGVAKLVGEKSFGKGSVQELIPLTPETSLKVTIARWLTPNGHSISENGIKPDIEAKITKEDIEKKRDPQLEKAASVLLDPNFTR